jgi:trans-aconitate methyltransferase
MFSWRLIKKSKNSAMWLLNTVYEAITGKVTLKYAVIKIWSQLTFVGKRFTDGVNWKSYNKHYLEELKITEKTNTLLIKDEEIVFYNGRIKYNKENIKPLIVNHELLYGTILNLNPAAVLEVGCGAGDHLANLKSLKSNLECHGVDLLSKQIDSLNLRHPNNKFNLTVADLTLRGCLLPETELVFTHAVLMHISEKENRYQNALENIFNAAQKHVVLLENWSQHDFFKDVNAYLRNQPEWKIYFETSSRDQQTRIMIISKMNLSIFRPLATYDDLLLGGKVIFH